MKNIDSYILDLDMVLEDWQLGLMDLDFVGSKSVMILRDRLAKLYEKYEKYDSDLDFLLENDSLGAG